jgi:hypothetical protein
MPVILATQEVEIRGIVVQAQPRQKATKSPSTNSWGMVAHTYHPSYAGSINRSIVVKAGEKYKSLFQK